MPTSATTKLQDSPNLVASAALSGKQKVQKIKPAAGVVKAASRKPKKAAPDAEATPIAAVKKAYKKTKSAAMKNELVKKAGAGGKAIKK